MQERMLLGTQSSMSPISWQPPAALSARCRADLSIAKMCKFTHRLFVLALLLQLQLWGVCRSWTTAAPAVAHKAQDQRLFGELLEQDYDYDLHYDQRQKGAENLRLKLDGFFIGLPEQDTSGFLLLTDDILEAVGDELLMGLSKSRSTLASTSTSTSSGASTTTVSPDIALNALDKLSPEPSPLSPPLIDMDTIIVEIPAAKKDFQARHQVHGSALTQAGGRNASRTKSNIFHLLNFLRGNKKV